MNAVFFSPGDIATSFFSQGEHMAVNLKNLSMTELQSLIDGAQAQISDTRKSLVASTRSQIDAILKKSGLTLEDVYPRKTGKAAKGKSRKGSTVAPKYQNPEDPSQTWTGRGRQPLWVTAALKRRGTRIEHLLIGVEKPAQTRAPKKAVKKASKKAVKKSGTRRVKA